MAKVGFWLRGMRGKFAGASFSKGQNGETIAREIVSHANPKTNAQLYQRAIMATIMKAYSVGKAIFDHSFEGKKVGSENQQAFMSLNARNLRAVVANEVNSGVAVAEQQGRVIAPKSKFPVPFTYIVSDGSYEANFIAAAGNIMPAALANETVAEYCRRLGIVENDYYTLVGFYIRNNNVSFAVDGYESVVYAKQHPCNFVYIRMKVKAGVGSNSDAISNLGQVLVVDDMTAGLPTPDLASIAPEAAVTMVALGITAATKGASGIIRSEKNNDLRSQCTLEFTTDMEFGLSSEFALAAWQQGSQELGDSSLILEGRESALSFSTAVSVGLSNLTVNGAALSIGGTKNVLNTASISGSVTVNNLDEGNAKIALGNYSVGASYASGTVLGQRSGSGEISLSCAALQTGTHNAWLFVDNVAVCRAFTIVSTEPENAGGGTGSVTQSVAAPVISGETPFAESTTVSMSGPDGAEIRYTRDGSTPTAESTLYSEAFTVTDSTTVKAIAIKDGNSSQVTTKEFTKSSGDGGNGGSGMDQN